MAGQPTPARPGAPATKTARQSQIVAILSREQVHSQEQLAGLLAQYASLHVAQATLSRDLDELGVVRLRAADGALVYALPGDPGGPGSRPGTGLDLTHYPERSEATAVTPAASATPGNADPAAPPDPSAARPRGVGSGSAGPPARTSDGPTGTRGSGGGSGSGSSGPGSGGPTGARGSGGSGPGSDRPTRTRGGNGSGSSDPGSGGPTGARGGSGSSSPSEAVNPSWTASGLAPAAADRGDRPPAGQPPRSAASLGGASARFTRYLRELLTSAEASANLVVLRTPAGAAQFLASAIDHAAWPAILGTVAGDDTVLVISRDPTGGEALAAEFRYLAEHRR